jgi:glycerol-3-phosphate dehydrogenase
MTAGDVLRRRTHLALEERTQGRSAAPRVVDLLARELCWTSSQQAQALEDYEAEAARYTVPNSPEVPTALRLSE